MEFILEGNVTWWQPNVVDSRGCCTGRGSVLCPYPQRLRIGPKDQAHANLNPLKYLLFGKIYIQPWLSVPRSLRMANRLVNVNITLQCQKVGHPC